MRPSMIGRYSKGGRAGCRSCTAIWKCAWSNCRAKRSESPDCLICTNRTSSGRGSSSTCRTEVEEFGRIAAQTGGQWVADKPRLLKVLKTAVRDVDFPPALADIFA